jgi:hypothetical protein
MLIPCAITVAKAAPSTPHLNTQINNKSSVTFSIVEIVIKIIGGTDSPTPRKIEMILLKQTNRNVPPTYILKYATASGITSSGVLVSRNNGSAIKIPMIEIKTPVINIKIKKDEKAL